MANLHSIIGRLSFSCNLVSDNEFSKALQSFDTFLHSNFYPLIHSVSKLRLCYDSQLQIEVYKVSIESYDQDKISELAKSCWRFV